MLTSKNGDTYHYLYGVIIADTPSSSAIHGWTYVRDIHKREVGLLRVRYNSNTDKDYLYYSVPMDVVTGLIFADSVGSFVAKEIKPKYSVTAEQG